MMGRIADGPDGTRLPWARDLDGVWHFRLADDWWETQADVQAHGRCGASFASFNASSYWPRHEDAEAEICIECAPLWREQEIGRLSRDVLDSWGPLYVEAFKEHGPPEIQSAIAFMETSADEAAS